MANQHNRKTPRYNLSFVIKETGMKADTLRAWERRYHLPQPQRGEGGHRLFSEEDIQTIKWLMERQQEGLSISHAVRLWQEIENHGQDPLAHSSNHPTIQSQDVSMQKGSGSLVEIRNAWIQACLAFDESTAEEQLFRAFAQFPLETVCVEILQSGLSEVGALWYQGKASVHQEHFASELAGRRLHTLLAAAPAPLRKKTILVGCPPGEVHTFPGLLVSLLLRNRGWHVISLGANVPTAHLLETIEDTEPDLVVLSAMRLTSSVTLYETVKLLAENKIPAAFGGWVFEHVPGLTQIIPGHYLGGEILNAVMEIEKLLLGPITPHRVESEKQDFQQIISDFINKKELIESETLESLAGKFGPEISAESIRDANEKLALDMIAALSLGELALVEPNLQWVKKLIGGHDIPEEVLLTYLAAYLEAAQNYLIDSGAPIIDWLASIIQSDI